VPVQGNAAFYQRIEFCYRLRTTYPSSLAPVLLVCFSQPVVLLLFLLFFSFLFIRIMLQGLARMLTSLL